ncbi:cytidine deaminase [Candidatus Pacearchaeota archaeon]|nr:cytidine deaminase [Candidatus Pacearchaeota archaeon]
MTWDYYFHCICLSVASKSNCLSRQIGAIIVKDNRIICTGYNGPPVGFRHCSTVTADEGVCPRRVAGFASGDGLHLCPANHAEANCIATAAMMGIQLKGTTMYCGCEIPCKTCFGLILNAGISEIVTETLLGYDELAVEMMKNSITRITVRQFSHL